MAKTGKRKKSEYGPTPSRKYWCDYYRLNYDKHIDPSDFAWFCYKYMNKGDGLIDLGCGNLRDAKFFNDLGIVVCAVDWVEPVDVPDDIEFLQLDINDLPKIKFDHGYMRFLLHSIKRKTETKLLDWAAKYCTNVYIEARSDKGETEQDTHYVRLVPFAAVSYKLRERGFTILHAVETDGLSVCGDSNPVLFRIIASKEPEKYDSTI